MIICLPYTAKKVIYGIDVVAQRRRNQSNQGGRQAATQRQASSNTNNSANEYKIQQQTLAPLPPVSGRNPHTPIEDFKHPADKSYKTNKKRAEKKDYDDTFMAFCRDECQKAYVDEYKLDLESFYELHQPLLLQAHLILIEGHDQMETLALDPVILLKMLVCGFGHPPAWKYGAEEYSWDYMKRWIVAWIDEANYLLKEDGWKNAVVFDVLLTYFKKWYLSQKLGAIICFRAKLVERGFRFSNVEAPAAQETSITEYKAYGMNMVRTSLDILNEFEKTLYITAPQPSASQDVNLTNNAAKHAIKSKAGCNVVKSGERNDNNFNDDNNANDNNNFNDNDDFKAISLPSTAGGPAGDCKVNTKSKANDNPPDIEANAKSTADGTGEDASTCDIVSVESDDMELEIRSDTLGGVGYEMIKN